MITVAWWLRINEIMKFPPPLGGSVLEGAWWRATLKNNSVCWVAAYLSGHNIFIQIKINSSAPSEKKLQYKVAMRNIVTIRPAGCKEKKKRRRRRKNLNEKDYSSQGHKTRSLKVIDPDSHWVSVRFLAKLRIWA